MFRKSRSDEICFKVAMENRSIIVGLSSESFFRIIIARRFKTLTIQYRSIFISRPPRTNAAHSENNLLPEENLQI